MKLSNNALNFLLAQYRAIFKRAYAKGIAPAIMLTAALTAGQAQAAWPTHDPSGDEITFITGRVQGTNDLSEGAILVGTASGSVVGNNTYAVASSLNDQTLTNNATIYLTTSSGQGQVLDAFVGDVVNEGSIYLKTSSDDANWYQSYALFNVGGETAGVSNTLTNNGLIDVTDAIGMAFSSTGEGSLVNGAEGVINVAASEGKGAVGMDMSSNTLNLADNALINQGTINTSGSGAYGIRVADGTAAGSIYNDGTISGTGVSIAVLDGSNTNTSGIDVTLADNSKVDSLKISDGNTVVFRNNTDSLTFETVNTSGTDAASTLTLINSKITFESGEGLSGAVFSDISLDANSLLTNKSDLTYTGTELTLNDDQFAGLVAGKLSLSGAESAAITIDGSLDLNELGVITEDGSLLGDNFAIEGTQTVTLAASTINLDSAYKAGNLSLDAGTLNFSGAATNKRFTISSGSITVHDVLNGAAATDRVVIKAESAGNTATLHLAADASGGVVTNVDRINVGWSSNAAGTSKLEVDGTWDFGDARITASSNAQVTINGTANNVSDLMMESNGHVTVNGAMTIERLLGAEDGTTGKIDLNGSLTIKGDGDLTDEGSNVNNVYFNDVQLPLATVNINNGGTLAINGEDALEDIFAVTKDDDGNVTSISVVASGSKNETHGGWDKTKINLNAGGTLSISVADIGLTSISTDDLKTLKNSLVNDNYQGAFNFGTGLTIKLGEELQTDIDDGEVDYSVLKDAGINDVQNVAEGVRVVVDASTATTGINLGNNAGAVKLEGSTDNLKVTGSLILTNTDGDFVYNEDGELAGVTLGNNAGANFTGTGNVGPLTKDNGATGTSVNLTSTGSNGLNVQGDIDLDNVNVNGGTVNVSGSVTANELTVDGILTVAQGSGAVTIGTSGATIAGGLNAGTITSSGNMDITGSVVADSLVLSDTNLTLAVGDTTSTGYVAVETLDLNGGMLLIDPDWNSNASFVVVTGANTSDVIDVNGSIGVGRNSVGVFGTTAAEAETSLARLGLLNGGKLDQNGIGAALYLGDTLAVADQKHVLIDKTKDNNGLSTAISALSSSGSVTLESGSALVISESFTDTLVHDPSQAIFEFGATAGTVTVTAKSGAQIIFDSADILGGDTVKVANSGTGVNVTTDLDDAEITAAGGLLTGTADDSTDRITFTLAQGAADHLYNQSNPVRDMTLDVIGNVNGAYDSSDAGVYYIGAMNAHNGGADIERTARMAVYAGAVQATLMAQQTSTDAVSERLGMANPNSALIASNNGQGGGLWLSPVYKNHDSDGFEAEGVNYGADIDLYGLALGADFTTESGVRVGAMFNVGSGDAEGQGMGESVSNDFDYYGFTLYAGVTFGNFALTADAGFTQVSNDLEQAVNYHGVGTLTADTDTQTVSVGVRGEYLFATPYVDIVPHVGLRYTNLDLDSYEARFNGYTVATTDADNMSVFSIPFGVTFSKEMSMGNWLVKPVFDLNLTANAGDDEIDTNTTFVGVESVALTSEVMDSFTYGASLGIDAQYQESISFGLNVGYTGSSNADEFGLNANARYVF